MKLSAEATDARGSKPVAGRESTTIEELVPMMVVAFDSAAADSSASYIRHGIHVKATGTDTGWSVIVYSASRHRRGVRTSRFTRVDNTSSTQKGALRMRSHV